MNYRIHIFGASGSGTSTLGAALSPRIGGKHLDTDSYYWLDTDPPYTDKRDPTDRVQLIERDTEGIDNWVLSGSICGWGDPLLDKFNLAVFLILDSDVRMDRLKKREADLYGERIRPGGDMYQIHLEFMEWAQSYDQAKAPTRSLDLHTQWMKRLACPIIELDSKNPTEDICSEALAALE